MQQPLLLVIYLLPVIAVAFHEKFFIYDWPSITKTFGTAYYLNESVKRYENFGAGRLIDLSIGSYNTEQYQLFLLMYYRALQDPRRTLDPEEATTFLIPYDLATDSAQFRTNHDILSMTNCARAPTIIKFLESSTYFNRKLGKDHLLLVGMNYAMDFFIM